MLTSHPMKITRIQSIITSVPFGPESAGSGGRIGLAAMDTLFVRVDTDDGVTGWGESFGFKLCAATKTAIDTLIAPLCIGRDPSAIAPLMADLHYRLHNYGRNGPALFGLAGLDIALWDIAGKVAGLPLYRLLGGQPRQEVPAYSSLWRYADAAAVRHNVERAVARGYRELKLHEIDIDIIRAACEAAGPDIPFMLDVNCTWNAQDAIAVTRKLRDLNVRWIEEPTWPPEDFTALAEVSRDGAFAVAAGENITSTAEFAAMLKLGAVAYAQPSVAKIGVSAMMEVIALARGHGIKLAAHSPYFGPGLIASLHLAAASGTEVPVERYYCDIETGPLGGSIEAANGMMSLPQGPGLGVEVDEELLARYSKA
jgi:D-galactarolactone cycloisomerase